MNFKEFFIESSMLAILMTTPPITLLIVLRLTDVKPLWLMLIIWAMITISWMTIIAIIYYKKSLKKMLSMSQGG